MLLAGIVVACAGAFASPADASTPVVTTITPTATTLQGSVTWEASVANGVPTEVDYLIDGTQKWVEHSPPYRFNGDTGVLDTRTLTNGQHTLALRALFSGGIVATSSLVVTISNLAPFQIAISRPAAGAIVSGQIPWEAVVTSGTASALDFSIDGTQRWVERASPYRYNGDTGSLDTKTLANGLHTLAVKGVSTDGRTTTVSVQVDVENGTGTRQVYCFGDPALGWPWDTTSLGWVRQASGPLSARVVYDDSVPLMSGCHTIKAEIQPTDPASGNGVRAQMFTDDAQLAKYAAQPALNIVRGGYQWYAFAFSTNAGYKPQNSQYPTWNTIYSWHDTCSPTCAPNPSISLNVSLAKLGLPGQGWVYFPTPKLSVDVLGGDPTTKPYEEHHWYTADFVPGKRYVVQMGVKWGDSQDGSIEVWIDGVQVVPPTTVSTMWKGHGVYPLFENYRYAATGVTWTNDVYYGGLVKGATRADVAIP